MTESKTKLILAIYFKGKALNPTEITSLLGIEPSKFSYFGQESLTSTQRSVISKTGLWAYSIDSETATVADLIHQLYERFKNCIHNLGSLPNVDECYVDLFAAHDAAFDSSGEYFFELANSDILMLERFGLPVRFTVASIFP